MSEDAIPFREGSVRHSLMQRVKRFAYRSPMLNFLSRPRYDYGIDPAQLSWLVTAIDATRSNAKPGSIVEVGVARGMTSAFLLEHLKRSGDKRRYVCIDSFAGFIPSDVDFEVNQRSKRPDVYGAFSYNDVDVFTANLNRVGYPRLQIHKGDASAFDFATIAPVDVMLLDVDLYVPTLNVLRNSLPHMNSPAYVMVDDCMDSNIYDGALQAYREFCQERGIGMRVVGTKGGIIEAA